MRASNHHSGDAAASLPPLTYRAHATVGPQTSSQTFSPLTVVAGDSIALVFDDGKTIYVYSLDFTKVWTIATQYQFNGWTLSGDDLYVQDGCVITHYNISLFVDAKPAMPDSGFNLFASIAFSNAYPYGIFTYSIGNPGTGYDKGDVLTVAGGTGGELSVTDIDGSGAVQTVALISAGSGYAAGTTAQATTGGNGSGASILVNSVIAGDVSGLFPLPAPASDNLQYSSPVIWNYPSPGPIFVLTSSNANGQPAVYGLPANLLGISGSSETIDAPAAPLSLVLSWVGNVYLQYLNANNEIAAVSANATPYSTQKSISFPSASAWNSITTLAARYRPAVNEPQLQVSIDLTQPNAPAVWSAHSVPVGSWQMLSLTDPVQAQSSVLLVQPGGASLNVTGGILAGGGSDSPLLTSAPCLVSVADDQFLFALLTLAGQVLLQSYQLAGSIAPVTGITDAWSMLGSQVGAVIPMIGALLDQQVNGASVPAGLPFDANESLICYCSILEAFGYATSSYAESLKGAGSEATQVVALANAALAANPEAGFTITEVQAALNTLCGVSPQSVADVLTRLGWQPVAVVDAIAPNLEGGRAAAVELLPVDFDNRVSKRNAFTPLQIFECMRADGAAATLRGLSALCGDALSVGGYWWSDRSPSGDTAVPLSTRAISIGKAMQHSGYSGEFVARLCHEVFSSHDTQDLDGAASAAAMLSCFVHPGGRRSFSAEDVVKLLAAFWPMPIAHAAVTAVSEFAEESRS